MYLQVAASGIQLASEVQNLQLVPVHNKSDRDMAQYDPSFIFWFFASPFAMIEMPKLGRCF